MHFFHLGGAHTSLEFFCELNVEEAYATNTMAVENAVYIANELDIPLLYISTAGIFDGAKQVYDDWDLPNPPLGIMRDRSTPASDSSSNTLDATSCAALDG